MRYVRPRANVTSIGEFPRAEIFLLNYVPLCGTYRAEHIVPKVYRIDKVDISVQIRRFPVGKCRRKPTRRICNLPQASMTSADVAIP